MTTLNARANQAYRDLVAEVEKDSEFVLDFTSKEGAFEEGWEKGFLSATAEALALLRALRSEAITSERKNAYDRAIEQVEGLS